VNGGLKYEMEKYYLSIDEKEILSDISQKTFDIWEVMSNYRKELHIGQKLIDIGGGIGHFTYKASKKGYNVTMIDVLKEFIERTREKYPELKDRVYLLDIFDEKKVMEFVQGKGQFDVVTVLGSVLNHVENKRELNGGLYNIVKLGETNSLFVIDLLLEEMFPEKPATIWSDFKHTLASFSNIGVFLREYGFRLLDMYSIHESYTPERELKYEEHSIRFFILKPW